MSPVDPPTDRPPQTRPHYAASPLRLDVEFRLFPEVLTYLELVYEGEDGPERGHDQARTVLNSTETNELWLLTAQVYLAATTDRRPRPGALRGFLLNPLGLTFLAISSALFILGAIELIGWVAGL